MNEITEHEKTEIAKILSKLTGRPKEENDVLINNIGVIRNYVSDCPEFTGDLFFIVWGSPETITYIGHLQTTKSDSWKVFYHGDLSAIEDCEEEDWDDYGKGVKEAMWEMR